MTTALRGFGSLVCIGLLATSVLAAQAQPVAPSEAKSPDQRLYEALLEITNYGATLFNNGDQNGCYRIFQGALMAARPQLDGRPDLQKAIDRGLADAERQHSTQQARAFALRRVMDDVRAALKPKSKGTSETPTTLWARLGGEQNVARVVDDFMALAVKDNRVNFTRNGRFKLDAGAVAHLHQELIDFVSQAAGGPYPYKGRSMKEVHKGMAITDAEFDAAAEDLRKALEKNGAKAADIEAVLKAVGGTRKDIVEAPDSGKKPAPAKPGGGS